MSSQITGEVKMELIESFPEGLARFFNFQQLLEENSLAANLWEAGRSENIIESLVSQKLAAKLWKAGCSSRIIEDIISQENPERNYKFFTAGDFNYRINCSECDDAWNSEFKSANENNIPPEVAKKIGGAFDFFYRFKNGSSISKLESVLNSDARIADLAQGTMEMPVELPARLARICHDYLYEAADFVLRKQAKELQEDYNKAIGENTDVEFVVLTYNAKPHTVSGVKKDYNYRIGENFKLHVIGTDKNSKEMIHKAATAEPDFLNLILCEDKDNPEQYFSAEAFNQRTNILPIPENLKSKLEYYIRNLKFDKRIIRGYDAVKLPDGDRIIPVLDDSEGAYFIRPVFDSERRKHAGKDGIIIRVLDNRENAYHIYPAPDSNYVTSKHAGKGFALKKMGSDGAKNISTIKTPSGDIYLDWYKGADRLVEAIVDEYWENTHYFHENW
jgi:hypothetical protein